MMDKQENSMKKKDDIDCKVLTAEEKNALRINVYKNSKILKFFYVFSGDEDRKEAKTMEDYSFVEDVFSKKTKTLLVIFVFSIALFLALNFVFSAVEGNLYMDGGNNIGFLEDPTNWAQIVTIGLMIFMTKGLCDRLSTLFIDLAYVVDFNKFSYEEYKSLSKSEEEYIQGKGKGGKKLLLLIIMFLIYSFYATFIYQYYYRSTDIWHNISYPLGFGSYTFYTFLMVGIVIPLISWRIIATIIILKKVFTILSHANAIKLRPLSPDNSGGLSSISKISLSMTYIVMIPMLLMFVGIIYLGFTHIAAISVPVYVTVLLLIFFLPLGTAHEIMSKSKELELHKISQEFNRAYDMIMENIAKKGLVVEEKELIETMGSLRNMYNEAKKMPVWPFDLSIIAKFIVTIIVPLTIVFVQIYL